MSFPPYSTSMTASASSVQVFTAIFLGVLANITTRWGGNRWKDGEKKKENASKYWQGCTKGPRCVAVCARCWGFWFGSLGWGVLGQERNRLCWPWAAVPCLGWKKECWSVPTALPVQRLLKQSCSQAGVASASLLLEELWKKAGRFPSPAWLGVVLPGGGSQLMGLIHLFCRSVGVGCNLLVMPHIPVLPNCSLGSG